MGSNLSRYRHDLAKLRKTGETVLTDLALRISARSAKLTAEDAQRAKELDGTFEREYQRWYTEAFAVLRQILPDRLAEFEHLYRGEPKRKNFNSTTYSIQDWLCGVRSVVNEYTGKKSFDDLASVLMRFKTQFEILKAAEARFESSLFEIRQILQADLFDHELDAARELLKNGFLRAAGAVAGVVLEDHLAEVCDNHKVAVTKKHPSIGDLNDQLKNHQVLDVPTWRLVQRLADLRNLCDHDREREPTRDEVADLIDGADKITKTVF